MPCDTSTLAALLDTRDLVVVDGAMATQLETLGVDTSTRLWSAVAMHSAPEAVRAVHRSYLDAGARVLLTNSYQAHPDDYVAAGHDADEAVDLIRASARLALEAVGQWRSDGGTDEVVVAGSLGPYGAHLADGSEYTGAYQLRHEQYQDFHRPRLEALAAEGITQFAVETQPRLDEVLAVLDLVEATVPAAGVMVGFSLRDASHLADGTSLAEAGRALDNRTCVAAVGVNCVPPDVVTGALATLAAATSKPLMACPNSGEQYDVAVKAWRASGGQVGLAGRASAWRAAGARLLGGCCRTTPVDIRALAAIA